MIRVDLKPLHIHRWEARALHEDRLSLIIRPVDPQPEEYPSVSGEMQYRLPHDGPFNLRELINYLTTSPPGFSHDNTTVYCCLEAFYGGSKNGYLFRADFRGEEAKRIPWSSANLLPCVGARFRLRPVSHQIGRLSNLTAQHAIGAGIHRVRICGTDRYIMDEDDVELNSLTRQTLPTDPLDAFRCHWAEHFDTPQAKRVLSYGDPSPQRAFVSYPWSGPQWVEEHMGKMHFMYSNAWIHVIKVEKI
jgi:hypothetical protein